MTEKTEGYYERQLAGLLAGIRPADRKAMKLSRSRWNSVAKPIGSLGLLEDAVVKIAGMTGNAAGMDIRKSALAVMCADHGVVEEGVTQTGQEVTRIVAENFARKETSVTIMCRLTGTDVFPVDMGMLGETPGEKELEPFVLLNRKVAVGSRNLVREAAMTREQCAEAVVQGIRLVGELKQRGYGIVATGEMGIGNTTPSSALASVLTGLSAEEATGRGAGLSDEGLLRKKMAVERAVRRFYRAHPEFPDSTVPDAAPVIGRGHVLTLLSELGGFDIAGMTGLFLGGAVSRIPVLIDGFISSVAALLAVTMEPAVRDFILATHESSEPACRLVLKCLGLPAPIHAGLHLGEGSGAVAFLPLLFMAADVYEKMGTFEDIQVEAYQDYGAEGEREL